MDRVNLFKNEKFRQIINENPDLPVVFLANEEANTGDWPLMYCDCVSVSVGEILNEETPYDEDTTFVDRDEFEERIAECICDEEQYQGMSNEDFDKEVQRIAAQYDDKWVDVIQVVVGN